MPKLVDVNENEEVTGSSPQNNSVQDTTTNTKDAPVDDVVEVDDEDLIADDEEYWPGGPNGAQVREWKEVYGDIYVTSITPERHIIWRTLTRFEYRRLVKSLDQQSSSGQVTQAEANLNNEEAIAETVILFPEYKRDQVGGYMGGIASLISQEAMEASGFVALEIRQL